MAILAYLCTLGANISAATVLECFTDAVSHIAIYGLPLRVRSDMGENFGVAQFMWSQPEKEAFSVIMVAVCIIKELKVYGEMFSIQGCTSLYYQLFFH